MLPRTVSRRPTLTHALRSCCFTVSFLALLFLPPLAAARAANVGSSSTWGTPIVLSATAHYRFTGVGFGHGVGMSQWGARGRAFDGQDAPTILSAYYPGTTLGSAVGFRLDMRVLLLHHLHLPAGAAITVVSGPVSLSSGQLLNTGDRLMLSAAPDGGVTVTLSTTPATSVATIAVGDRWTISGSDTTELGVGFKPAPVTPAGRANVYHGSITLAPSWSGLDVVNDVSLETYLDGSVPAEMPARWPFEALRAQAIAARSYALVHQRDAAALSDLDDSTASQVYLGARSERLVTNDAVATTAGLVLLYDGAPILAYYHACDAGHTENASNLFPGVWEPYLLGVSDIAPNGVPYDHGCTHATWQTGALTRAQLAAALEPAVRAQIGTLHWVDLSDRSSTGRVVEVVVSGSRGTVAIPAQQFRLAYNRARHGAGEQLLSTAFTLKAAW